MEDIELRNVLLSLMEAQITNNLLILIGSLSRQLDDDFMIELFNSQDDMYSEMRRIIKLCPNVNKGYLDNFDELLHDYRLNILLCLQKIKPCVN